MRRQAQILFDACERDQDLVMLTLIGGGVAESSRPRQKSHVVCQNSREIGSAGHVWVPRHQVPISPAVGGGGQGFWRGEIGFDAGFSRKGGRKFQFGAASTGHEFTPKSGA